MKTCNTCGEENPSAAQLCGHCNAPLMIRGWMTLQVVEGGYALVHGPFWSDETALRKMVHEPGWAVAMTEDALVTGANKVKVNGIWYWGGKEISLASDATVITVIVQ